MGRPRKTTAERHWEAIGRRLATLRVAVAPDVSQSEFCRVLRVGKSQWNQFETGERKITTEVALKLKHRYGVTTDWIYDNDPSQLPFDLHQKIAV